MTRLEPAAVQCVLESNAGISTPRAQTILGTVQFLDGMKWQVAATPAS